MINLFITHIACWRWTHLHTLRHLCFVAFLIRPMLIISIISCVISLSLSAAGPLMTNQLPSAAAVVVVEIIIFIVACAIKSAYTQYPLKVFNSVCVSDHQSLIFVLNCSGCWFDSWLYVWASTHTHRSTSLRSYSCSRTQSPHPTPSNYHGQQNYFLLWSLSTKNNGSLRSVQHTINWIPVCYSVTLSYWGNLIPVLVKSAYPYFWLSIVSALRTPNNCAKCSVQYT